MKRAPLLVFFLTAAFLFITSMDSWVLANTRFAEGFRGIAWETHKDNLPDLGLSKASLKKIYASGPSSVLFMEGKGNLELSFDEVPLLSIFMHFDDQYFTGVDMIFRPENREKIVSSIASDTGDASSESDGNNHWRTGSIQIIVTDRELMIRAEKSSQ